jgi:hypothetical protein
MYLFFSFSLLAYGADDIYDIHVCIIFFFTFFGSFHHSFTIYIVAVWEIKDKFIFDQLDRFAMSKYIIYTNGSITTHSVIYF